MGHQRHQAQLLLIPAVLFTLFMVACGGGDAATVAPQLAATTSPTAAPTTSPGTPTPPPTATPIPNRDPVASATKANTARTNQPVVLNGAASFDPERDPLTFVWSIDAAPSGSTAFLRSATEQISFLTADKEGEYVLSLLVQDGRGGSSRDVLTVFLDNDGDGLIGADDPDRDGDNVPNVRDAFPDDPGEFIDSDGDGVGNFADLDEDGDGVPDHIDLAPFDRSLSQYPQITETEFNDRLEDADLTGTTYPLQITGVIQEDSDSDFFGFFASGEDLITATLTKEDPDYHPMLSFADANGNPLQAIYQFISETSDAVATISTFIPADGEYLVIVNNLNFQGAAGFTYTLDIFRDLDLDTLDDDLEVALGVNSRLADSDGDGLFDAAEVNVYDSDGTFIPDVDGDGVPNWLDFDSDGDGIPDWLEGIADVDGDLLGNFVDLDSDGNGIPDEIEVGPNPILPLDWDGDGVPDFQDTDDDNDGILDTNDDNRFQPIAQSDILAPDPADRLVLETSRVDFGSGNAIEGVARAGDMLLLEGSGFSNIASENLVIFADVTGRTLNLSPSSATATRLEIKVPEIASSQVFVVTGDMRSNGFDLRILGSGSPVLFPRFPFTGNMDTTVTLEGRNFDGTAVVNFGGVAVLPLRVTDSSLDVIAGC